jgi:hypothetical protein
MFNNTHLQDTIFFFLLFRKELQRGITLDIEDIYLISEELPNAKL